MAEFKKIDIFGELNAVTEEGIVVDVSQVRDGAKNTELQAEIERAKDAEATIDTDLKDEITRSTDKDTQLENALSELDTRVGTNEASLKVFEAKVPAQASADNQLADKEFVNSSINGVAAYYITKNELREAFATKAELIGASVFYSGGQPRTPTRNDYAIVIADEDHVDPVSSIPATTRYLYNNGWEFQYIVNNTPFTAAQWAAVNSGATDTLVGQITKNKNDISTLNTNLKNYLPLAGGTMTGAITLAGAPTSDLEPATKKYVDDLITTSTSDGYIKPSDGIPKTDLDSSVQASLDKADNAMPKSGGQFTGQVSWNESSLPNTLTSDFFLVIEPFASGGKTYYVPAEQVKTNLGINAAIDTANSAKSTADSAASTASSALSKANNAVLFTSQTLNSNQKLQARNNIGAGTSNFSGNYNDLYNQPYIPSIPSISVSTSGSGNAVTSISADGHSVSVTKGTTFLTSHQSLPNITVTQGGNAGYFITGLSASGHTITYYKDYPIINGVLTSSQNGWIRIPFSGGRHLCIEWGYELLSGNSSRAISFKNSFYKEPTVVISQSDGSSNGTYVGGIEVTSTTTTRFYAQTYQSENTYFLWIAIGGA